MKKALASFILLGTASLLLWGAQIHVCDNESDCGWSATYQSERSTDVACSGSYSHKMTGASGYFRYDLGTPGPVSTRTYIRVGSLPASDRVIRGFSDSGGTTLATVVLQADGDIGVTMVGSTTVYTSDQPIAINTWYLIEATCDTSQVAGQDKIYARVNGADEISITNGNRGNNVGRVSGNGNSGWYFDDMLIQDYADGWPGPAYGGCGGAPPGGGKRRALVIGD